MRVSTWIGCVAFVALLSIPTFAQDQGWIPVHYDPSVDTWEAVPSWDPGVSQRRTRLAAAEEVDFASAGSEHQEYDETLIPAPSEHQPSTVEGNGRRRTRPQRYNGVSQVSKSGESAARSSRRSDLDENAEVTAPKPRVRTSARAESQGRRRAEGRTTEEPSTSASPPRRGGSRFTEQSKDQPSSTSAPRRGGVRTRAGYQRSTSTNAPDLTSSASNNEASEVTRRPSVRGNSARRIPPSRAASTNTAAKNVASRSQLPSLASNESSRSDDQQHETSSEKPQNQSSPVLSSTLIPVKIQTTQPTLPISATSIKSTRNAPLADIVNAPIHIVVTPKPKPKFINIITQKPLSTLKPMSIIFVPEKNEKFIPLKNKELNNLNLISIAQNVVSSTANPNSNNKFKDENKSIFKIDLSPNQNTHKILIPEKTVQSTTPTNKIIQVKSVTVISNTREEISIRPQKVSTPYSNVTPKSKFVSIVKSVTPKSDHGKAIQINSVSTTAAPKIRLKVNTSNSNIDKNASFSTTPKSITTERSLSSNSITPATKTASKLVSVSLKSAVLDLSPPVTTPKTRPSTTTSRIYNPYNSIITITPPSRVSKPDSHNRSSTTNFTTDKIPTTRPSITTSDRPYPVFVPELHSSSTSPPPSIQQQVTSLASKRRKVSTEVKVKAPEIEIDDDDNYPEEFKQRILGGKKELSTTPAPKKKDALLDVDNLVSKPREVTTAIPRKFIPPTREEPENNIDEDNLISRPRDVNTRLRSSSRLRDVSTTTSVPPRRRTTPQPTSTKAPEITESSVRTAAAIRTRGELLRKSIRGRSTPQPSSFVTEEETTETSAVSSTLKPRYSARQRRPEKDVETESEDAAPFVQRFSSKYRSDIRGSVSSTPAYVATVPSVTQLPEKEPSRRLAKFPSLSLRAPPKRWIPKSKSQILENRLVTTLPPITHYSSITSSAQASTNVEISTQSPQEVSNTEVQVTLPESSTPNILISSAENLLNSSLVEIVSPKNNPSTTRARNIIYSSTVPSSVSPSIEVTSPTSAAYTRARNIIFSTQEPLTHTLSIEAMFSKSIFSPRSLLLESDISTSSTTEATTKVSNLETYSTISSYLTTPKNNIKPEVISSTTSERTLTTRQATTYLSTTTEKPTTVKQATTVRSTTVQYTSSYSKVASIGLNPATTPIPSVVLASSAPDIATPPPRFAMRIPIAPIGTKSSTPTPHTTTIRHSTYPLNSVTTTHKIITSTQSLATSTVKPISSSIRTVTTTTPLPTLTTSTFKPSTTSSKPITSTTPISTTVKHTTPQTTTTSVKLSTSSTTTQKPTPSTTVRLTTSKPSTTVQPTTRITSTTVRLTTPKPTTTTTKATTTSSTTTTTTQPPKHSSNLNSHTNRSVPDKTEVIIKDNEIPKISLAAPPPARDPAARGLKFTSPSESVIFTSPSPSPRSTSLVVSSTPLISLSLVEIKTEEPLTALSSSVSLSTEPTTNVTTTERSTYIYKIPPNPNKSSRKGASRGNSNFRVLTTDTVPSTTRTTTPTLPTTTETPVPSTTQFRWKPVTAAASTSIQSESTSTKTQTESEPSKTLNILENLVQATKDKTVSDTGVYTVTPQTPVVQSTTTEFEGLSLANLAYKSIVRSRGPNSTPPPRSTRTSTTTTTTPAPSRGRKVPTDSVTIISDNNESSNNVRQPNKQSNNNNGDGNKMAVWVVPKNTFSSTTTTTQAPKSTTTPKPLSGELGGLTAQDLLLLEILSKRRPSGAAAAPAPSVNFGGGLDLATLIAAGDNIRDDPPPVRSTTRRPRITSTTTTTPPPFYDDPEPSGGGGGGAGFQGSGSSLLHILRAIGGASSVPQAPAPAPAKYEPQEDVILEPATTTTRTRGRQRNPSRKPVTQRTTTTEEPYYDTEPESNQQPSQLVTVAINVTKTVASLMGRVLQGAARTVSAVVRESTRQLSGYLQNWQQPQQ